MRESITAARTGAVELAVDGAAMVQFRFGAKDPVFAGHFPDRPLLPGIFQLEMARSAAEWVLESPLIVREICRAKFLRPIVPEELVRLELKLSEQNGEIRARAAFSAGGQAAGEAVLLLAR